MIFNQKGGFQNDVTMIAPSRQHQFERQPKKNIPTEKVPKYKNSRIF